jgi:hypothetical protein
MTQINLFSVMEYPLENTSLGIVNTMCGFVDALAIQNHHRQKLLFPKWKFWA